MTLEKAFPRPSAPGWLTMLDLGRDQLERPIHYFERLGDSFASSWFGVPMIASRDPALFEEVLVRQHKHFIKDAVTRGLSGLLGNGLLTSEGEEWRKNRRIVSPHFRATDIGAYLAVFHEEAERELQRWPAGGALDVHRAMTRVTLRVVLRTVFGSDGSEDMDIERSMHDVVAHALGVAGTWVTLPLYLPTPANRRFLRGRAHLRSEAARLIAQARTQGSRKSVLGSLLAAQESGALSEQQLIDEAITFLLAGHETSALTLSYTLALLAAHPGEQRAIQEELTALAPDDLDALRCTARLTATVKESLRLYPPAWSMGREATQDCELGGVPVRAGTQVFLFQWAAHRHPQWFPEPGAFRPQRWTPENEAGLPRCLYMPFGAGPRVCVGNQFAMAEILVVLGTLLRRFDFSLAQPFVPRFQPALTLRPRAPVLLTTQPRWTH
jgi:cytochrome P450